MTIAPDDWITAARTVVLVEGLSDRFAVQALAERHDRDLEADGVFIVAMGGATNIGHYLDTFGPHGLDIGLAGLCDEAEIRFFVRSLEKVGLGVDLTRAGLELLQFQVCVPDLEAELIRALGVSAMERILDAEGDLTSFRIFQQQPAQQGKSDEARLRRFLGTRGGRKIHYARVLVAALDLSHTPPPLDRLLAGI